MAITKVVSLEISNCSECPYVYETCGTYWCNYDGEDGEFAKNELENPRKEVPAFCPLPDKTDNN